MNRINIITILLSSLIIAGYGGILYITLISPQQPRLHIVCTTTLLADAVRNITKDLAHITTLMGPGIDPHIYQAKESDAHAIAQANIIFCHGLHLEGKLSHILSQLPHKICISVSDIIPHASLITGDIDTVYDPHVWHDVQLWKYVIDNISSTLQSIDRDHANYYKSNTKQYINKLDQLDRKIKRYVKKLPPKKRVLVTAHDAFSYFGKAYGFKIISLQGINTQIEISMNDISNVVDAIINNRTSIIFLENSTPERNIQAVQQCAIQRNWSISIGPELYSDSLDHQYKAAGSYIGMMTANVRSIVESLV